MMLIAKDGACNSNEEEHQHFFIEVVHHFHFLQNIDSGVKVKECHDVDCNFAKDGVCNNEDEHQKQWNEAEKATEEVLMIKIICCSSFSDC